MRNTTVTKHQKNNNAFSQCECKCKCGCKPSLPIVPLLKLIRLSVNYQIFPQLCTKHTHTRPSISSAIRNMTLHYSCRHRHRLLLADSLLCLILTLLFLGFPSFSISFVVLLIFYAQHCNLAKLSPSTHRSHNAQRTTVCSDPIIVLVEDRKGVNNVGGDQFEIACHPVGYPFSSSIDHRPNPIGSDTDALSLFLSFPGFLLFFSTIAASKK